MKCSFFRMGFIAGSPSIAEDNIYGLVARLVEKNICRSVLIFFYLEKLE